MKIALCIIAALICILLSSCGNDSGIGVIEGSDGPAAIFVTNKGENKMYQQITPDGAKKIMDSD